MTRVQELMVANPVTVSESATLAECSTVMNDEDIRHLPVVDDTGRLIGLLSDFDVLRHGPKEVAGRAVCAVPFKAFPGDLLSDVLSGQITRSMEAIVVIDDNKHPVGILTEHDAVALAATQIPPQWRIDASVRKVLAVDWNDPVVEAWETMLKNRIRHIVVTRDKTPVTVLSWRDLAKESVREGDTRTAGDLAGDRELHALETAAPLADAAAIMVRHRIGCVPVVDDGRLQGILTRTDIIDTLLTLLEAGE